MLPILTQEDQLKNEQEGKTGTKKSPKISSLLTPKLLHTSSDLEVQRSMLSSSPFTAVSSIK